MITDYMIQRIMIRRDSHSSFTHVTINTKTNVKQPNKHCRRNFLTFDFEVASFNFLTLRERKMNETLNLNLNLAFPLVFWSL